MENFTNETIDTTNLPKYEEITYSKLHSSYWKVILIKLVLTFVFLFTAAGLTVTYIEEYSPYKTIIFQVISILFIPILLISRLSFNKKGFSFRDHDVLFRSGIIATNTIIIPYNRIQHVALHEGIISHYFGLAKIEIFTAGESSSDINIPGIEKEHAENIKQLLMGKIRKQL